MGTLKTEISASYAILQKIEECLQNQDDYVNNESLYDEIVKKFECGEISEFEVPDIESEIYDIYKIELDGDFIVITFVFMSMMVCNDYVREFLWYKKHLLSLGLRKYGNYKIIDYVRKKNLGIKLTAFAGIGGEGYYDNTITLCEPGKIQEVIDNGYPYDIYGLQRFVNAQEKETEGFKSAIRELNNGKKQGHWIWYIFPQIKGLGKSHASEFYAISCREEAKNYYEHPILGKRLREAFKAILSHKGKKTILEIMDNFLDALKVKSSATLFYAATEDPLFKQVIDDFFFNTIDFKTIRLLNGDQPD